MIFGILCRIPALLKHIFSSEGTLREIFDEETNKSDFGGHVSFIDMENSMYKRRRLNRPTVSQDAEEAITLLNNCSDEFRTYFIFSINEPANREFAVGFMSPKWLTALRFDSETLLQADATFYVVPKLFYQLLNIFLHYRSYTLPAFHILMSCKSRALYDKIVVKIKTILSFTVSDIITDFEEALFQSFSSGFPEADGSGCLFHFKKATYQTGILKNGLANLYSGDEQFKSWVQLLMNLPLLPSEKISETFHLVKDLKPELLATDIEKVDKFLRYYERYWLRQVGSSRLSVFQKGKQTTNDLESFHASLKHKFKSHSPNFWEFCRKLNKKVILSDEKNMERIDHGLSIQRNWTRPKTIQRNQR